MHSSEFTHRRPDIRNKFIILYQYNIQYTRSFAIYQIFQILLSLEITLNALLNDSITHDYINLFATSLLVNFQES